MSHEKVAVVIQARKGSTRLPGKVHRSVAGGESIVGHLVNRLRPLKIPLVLAVPRGEQGDFQNLRHSAEIQFFEGDEDDVLGRYYFCAKTYGIETIIRATGDNPLTCEACIPLGLALHKEGGYDVSFLEGLPYGSGVEFIRFGVLEEAYRESKKSDEREHVTAFFYRRSHRFKIGKNEAPSPYHIPSLRVTVDTEEDFCRYESWVSALGLEEGGYLSLEKVIATIAL